MRVASADGAALESAKERINLIAFPPQPEEGKEYEGEVVNITTFGAFINILPGRDGLLHISKLDPDRRVNRVEDYLSEGQKVKVVVEGMDRGKLSLILAERLPGPPAGQDGARRTGGGRGPRGGGRQGGGRGPRGGGRQGGGRGPRGGDRQGGGRGGDRRGGGRSGGGDRRGGGRQGGGRGPRSGDRRGGGGRSSGPKRQGGRGPGSGGPKQGAHRRRAKAFGDHLDR